MATLPVLPLRNLVLLPGAVQAVDVGRPGSLKLVEQVIAAPPARLLLATQKDPKNDNPSPSDLHPIAVEAEILKVVRLDSTRLSLVVRALGRRGLGSYVQTQPFLIAETIPTIETNVSGAEVEDLAMAVRDAAKQLVTRTPDIPSEAAALFDTVHEPGRLADAVAAAVDLDAETRLALLAELDVKHRLEAVLAKLQHLVQVLEVKDKIDEQVREEIGRTQREHILRQKMKAIREELGEGEDDEGTEELEKRLAEANLPEEAHKAARRQITRLSQMQSGSPEYQVTRTYVDWLLELPWDKRSEDRLDVEGARAQLEADHHGLDKVKKRILEHLAVRRLAPKKRAPILCFYGPPGVGKTSLGRSIAKALGREFVRISLGGVRDEAEIRGHRRTYIGALPGRIIQALKRAGTKNPIFMLDEIDKLSADFRGDPQSALLEVLDPEQNFSFSDHYLEVPFDLSEVMFIATANDLATVSPPLRDRMEVIEVPGYTSREKEEIAIRHLTPKQLGEHGLTTDHVTIARDAIGEIIDHYTREAGVRNLERELANVIRGVAVKVASGGAWKAELHALDVAELLGPPRFESETAERTSEPGVATGMAWTPAGGDILFIEATRMPGKGTLVLTGQLGDVMKESAQAALSWVRAHAVDLGVPAEFMETSDLHLHIPAGATPKDGPSAGVTLTAALVSLLTGRRVRPDVAMTGEVTLRGAVLPVGGIKEKVLAAHRAGVTTVILPERNEKDLVDVPPEVREALTFVSARRVGDVLDAALEPGVILPTGDHPPAAVYAG